MEGGIRMVRAGTVGTLGVALALLAAPLAAADTEVPADPSAPLVVVEVPAVADVAAVSPADQTAVPAALTPADQTAVPAAVTPAGQTATAAPLAASVSPPDGVPHLTTPDHLPPGTTQQPTQSTGSTTAYLKDIWNAVRNQDVTMSEALVLIAQRPMGSNVPLQDMTPRSAAVPSAVPLAPAAPAAETPATEVPATASQPAAEVPAEPVLLLPVTP